MNSSSVKLDRELEQVLEHQGRLEKRRRDLELARGAGLDLEIEQKARAMAAADSSSRLWRDFRDSYISSLAGRGRLQSVRNAWARLVFAFSLDHAHIARESFVVLLREVHREARATPLRTAPKRATAPAPASSPSSGTWAPAPPEVKSATPG